MTTENSLTIPYRQHDRVDRLIDVLTFHLETIALGFDRWGESRVFGPGMYIAVVVGPSVRSYADPMGANRWPDDGIRDPFADPDAFAKAVSEVAYDCDGAVLVSVDGVVSPQLVRFRMEEMPMDLDYEPWMGARHMSALDISTRPDVVATLTLSEETGRVTVFEDGSFESVQRQDLGRPWREETS